MIQTRQIVYQGPNILYTYIHKFVTVILYGALGSGKTTLYNLLTNSSKSTYSISGGSVTRGLYKKQSAYGQAYFIYDTPGTGSLKDQQQHIFRIQHALTLEPLNRIFLCTKYHERLDRILQDIKKQILPIYEYKHLITIIVTHWDLCKKDEKEDRHHAYEKSIIEEFSLNSESQIIFVGLGCDGAKLSELIYNSSCQGDPQQLDLADDQIPIEISYQMEVALKQMKNGFIKQGTYLFHLIDEVKRIGNIYERDQILHAIGIEAYELSRGFVRTFEEKYGKQMVEADVYDHLMLLQKSIYPKAQSISNQALSNMSYSIMNLADPRNHFKRCPHCQLVWFKAEECDETICGNLPSKGDAPDTQSHTYFKRIKFFYEDNKVYYKKFAPNVYSGSSQSAAAKKALGCRKFFFWREQPCLSLEEIEVLSKGFFNDFIAEETKNNHKKQMQKQRESIQIKQ